MEEISPLLESLETPIPTPPLLCVFWLVEFPLTILCPGYVLIRETLLLCVLPAVYDCVLRLLSLLFELLPLEFPLSIPNRFGMRSVLSSQKSINYEMRVWSWFLSLRCVPNIKTRPGFIRVMLVVFET